MLLRFIKHQYQRFQVFASELRARHLEQLDREERECLARIQPQSESDFIAQCFQTPCDRERRVALGIRNAIAKLGEIEPKFIRADASFESLDLFEFWVNIGDVDFDTFLFIESIEKEIGIEFTKNQLKSLSAPDPDLYPRMKIQDFIRAFYQWYSGLEYKDDSDSL